MKTVDAGALAVSYLEDGPSGGWPVILCHGFLQGDTPRELAAIVERFVFST